LKTCSKCKIEKPLEAFSKQKEKKDGHRSHCKECVRAKYVANAEEVKAKRRAYVEANKEAVYARNQAYREANREELNAKKIEWFQTENGYWCMRKGGWRKQGILDVDTLDWEAFVEAQGNACKVCGDTIDARSAIRDHDHETGLTRGAVCSIKCNLAMDRI